MTDSNRFLQIEETEANLKAAAVRGGAVTMAAQACRFTLNVGSTMVLARLLTPNDFGLIAMVTAITGFVVLFKDMGLSMATVQRPKIDHAQISALFWVNVGISLAIMLLVAAVAPAIAWFYGEPRLTGVTLVLACAFIFGGLTVQHQALLKRQMRFAALAAIEITAMVVGIGIAIVLAWYGAGYWALVFMQLAVGITTTVGVWSMCGWRPGWPARRAGIRSMLAFGGHLTGFNTINYFSRNLDNVLIGWYWGAQQTGLYSKAYQLLLLPIRQISTPIASVAIPALSRLQNDPVRYRRYYCKAMNLIAFLTTPLIVGMAALSDEVIVILLGNQWLGASRIFKVLAIAALFQPLANATGWIFVSLDQTKRMMQWAMMSTPPLILAFVIGLPWGALGVAIAYTIVVYILLLPLFLFAFRYSPVKLSDLIGATWRPVVISMIMYAVMAVTRFYLASWSPVWIVLGSYTTGFLTLAVSTLIWPRARAEALDLIGTLRMLSIKRSVVQGSHTQHPVKGETVVVTQ